MSPADYIAKCKTYRRYTVVASVFYTIAIAVAIVMSLWIHRTGCESLACLLAVLLTASLIGGVMFYTGMRGPTKRARALGLLCPSCTKPLVAWGGQPIVVSSRCGHCGIQGLDS